MKEAFLIATQVLSALVMLIGPFVAVLCGVESRLVIIVSWLLSIFLFVGLCIGLPMIVATIDPTFTREFQQKWVPESTALGPVVMAGWFPAFLSATAASCIKEFLRGIREGNQPAPPTERNQPTARD